MDNPENSLQIKETPSSIVSIAYSQLSMMKGMRDLAEPTITKEDNNEMACTRRFFRLPIFVSVTSALCHTYKTIKESHETVTTVFDNVENGLSKGVEYASPLTNRIGETLETPLKTVDNAVCVGLDFLEEKLPSIKLPPYEIYENLTNNIRQVISSVVQTSVILFGNIVRQVDQLKVFVDKNSQDDKNNNNTEKSE